MKTDDETARTVPPFIPGLLIVSLLLFVSVLIGWRSYVRRMNVRVMMERSPDWTIWDGLEGGVPKLWEVRIVPRGGVPSATSWKQITPLSATRITPEPTTDDTDAPAPAPAATEPHTRPSPRKPSRFHRPQFSSPTPAPPVPSAPALPLPTARLQVSVLISMPSLARSKSPRSSLSIDLDGTSPSPMTTPTPHKRVDKKYHLDDEDEDEGAPDVAFGVVVLPWRNTEGQTNIS